MPKVNNGGYAFPLPAVPGTNAPWEGMTLRQWYAGNAPDYVAETIEQMSLVQVRKYLGVHIEMWTPAVKLQVIAKLQFEYADAMIAEGEKDR